MTWQCIRACLCGVATEQYAGQDLTSVMTNRVAMFIAGGRTAECKGGQGLPG